MTFQGGRIGPPHYDLASLLIDPYVDLPFALRETLLVFFSRRLAQRTGIAATEIRKAYRYCALARNLQILGAYGFLTRRKGKPQFATYIPAAVQSLQQNLTRFDNDEFPMLSKSRMMPYRNICPRDKRLRRTLEDQANPCYGE